MNDWFAIGLVAYVLVGLVLARVFGRGSKFEKDVDQEYADNVLTGDPMPGVWLLLVGVVVWPLALVIIFWPSTGRQQSAPRADNTTSEDGPSGS